jgi:hypothetical protein
MVRQGRPPDACGAPRPWFACAVELWLLVAIIISIRVAWTPYRNTVYPILAHGVANWVQGADLYTPERQLANFDAFVYPPPAVCVFLPFSILSDRIGGIVWRLVNLGVYLAAFIWFWKGGAPGSTPRLEQDPRRRAGGRLGLLLLLLLPHSIDSLNNGQSNMLIAGLLMAGVGAALRERWNLAAVCLAVPCLLKIYPLAIGLLLALVFPRPLLPRLGLALAAGLAAPFLCQSPDYVADQYQQYGQWVIGHDRTSWNLHNAPHDFYFLTRWLGTPLPRGAYIALQLTTAALAAGWCWALRRRGVENAVAARRLLGLGIGWIICFGPATESSTYILLAPVLAWEMLAAWTGASRAGRLPITAVYALLCASGMSLWFPGGRRVAQLLQPLAGLVHFLLQNWLAGKCLGGLKHAPMTETIEIHASRIVLTAPATAPITDASVADAPEHAVY